MVTIKILQRPETEAFFPLQDTFLQMLSVYERYSIERTKKEKDKIEKTLGWVLCRMEAAKLYDVHPADIQIDFHDKGKPFFPDYPGFAFNITHGGNLIIVAFSDGEEVGVDVEALGRKVNPEIATRHFTKYEADFLQNVSDKNRREMFLRFWTVKEAYLKMIGTGLTRPLSSFEIKFFPERICIYEEDKLQNCSTRQDDSDGKHIITVCVKGEENNFRFHETDIKTIINFVEKTGKGERN